MGSFQTTTLVIAFVILVLTLIWVGVMMSNTTNSSVPFPPYLHTCPDYWGVMSSKSSSSSSSPDAAAAADAGSSSSNSVTGGGHVCVLPACNSGLNVGSLCKSDGTYDFDDSNKHLQSDPASGNVFINPKDTLSSNPVPFCSLSDWASTYGVNWDGVSNTNQC